MTNRTNRVLILIVTAILLVGCDTYSLLDQFIPNGGLRLTPQTATLRPGETTQLYPEGGTAPYTIHAIAEDLFNDGNPYELGVVDDTVPDYSYTAGNSIGRVSLRVTDSLGQSTNTTVTVQPHPPSTVVADGSYGGPLSVQLTWSYVLADYIQGFRILRSTDGVNFTTIADTGVLPSGATSYTDNAPNPALYTYRIYAVADVYSSAYVQVVAQSNA